jgi:hypothetical protein
VLLSLKPLGSTHTKNPVCQKSTTIRKIRDFKVHNRQYSVAKEADEIMWTGRSMFTIPLN